MKKQKGITLIALVITIIVLLILAGISINAVVGQNGILTRAQQAVTETQKAELEEILEMYNAANYLGNNQDFKQFLLENQMINEEELNNSGIAKIKNNENFLAISNQKGLENITNEVANGNDYSGVVIYLLNDIEFNNEIDFTTGTLISGTEFLPIGDSNSEIEKEELEGSVKKEFNGTFDGLDHEIKKLYISETEETDYCAGLFGYIGKNGIVKNVIISDSYITGAFETGVIAGRNRGTISNCVNKCDINAVKLTGGIAGRNTGIIENCTNYGNIISTKHQTGGIVGNCDFSEEVIVRNCKNYGDIKSTLGTIGGIVGGAFAGNEEVYAYVTISNCENYGRIIGEGNTCNRIGGIVGTSRGTVEECVNLGEVIGYKEVGGIVGSTEPFESITTFIENCKNKGNVTGKSERIGGICGSNNGGDISKSSNYGEVQLIGIETYYGIAGIAGVSSSSIIDIKVEYCYNVGTITLELSNEKSGQIGGIVGNGGGTTKLEIISCYNIGDLICTGSSSGARPVGIINWGKNIVIKNCYNIGNLVKSNNNPKGILNAWEETAIYENNYWLNTCGADYGVGTSNIGGEPKTEAEMKALAAILGSDYAQDNNINNGYPYLKVNKP